jgi:hypothetical protein
VPATSIVRRPLTAVSRMPLLRYAGPVQVLRWKSTRTPGQKITQGAGTRVGRAGNRSSGGTIDEGIALELFWGCRMGFMVCVKDLKRYTTMAIGRNRKIFRCTSPIDNGRNLHRMVAGSFGSVRNTMVHMMSADVGMAGSQRRRGTWSGIGRHELSYCRVTGLTNGARSRRICASFWRP